MVVFRRQLAGQYLMIICNTANTFAAMQYIVLLFVFVYKELRLGIEYAPL